MKFVQRLFLGVFVWFLCIGMAWGQVARHGMTSEKYQAEFNKWTGKGYRLVLVDGYNVGGKVRYAAIWEKKSGGAWKAHHGMTGSQYQSKFNEYTRAGYRLTHVSGYSSGGQARYAAIWEKKSGGAWKTHHGMTGSQYQSKFNEYSKAGYQLVLVDGYGVGDKAYYVAIWEKRTGSYKAHHGMTSSQYQSKFNEYNRAGYRLDLVSGYNVGSKMYYAAIWRKTRGGALWAKHGLSSKNYQAEFDNQYYQGYRIKQVSGYSNGSSARYAAIWESTGAWKSADIAHIDKTVKDFMEKHNVSGASLAIAKDGKLVFAKGYGMADKSKGETVGAKSLFRVASVSKPITGVAIMQLVQEGKLKLSDKVFGSGAILGTTYGSEPYGSREKAITVQQLLEHTAGGKTWNNDGGDGSGAPMFQNKSYDHKKLIGWILDERNPSATPGTTYEYSNFGYCVLGRIIEKKTGMSYSKYVKSKVLSKCGIKDMHIGGSTLADKRHNEVVYYGGNPYGYNIERMDAHGAWIASAVDLVRFAVHVDGYNTEPDILNSSTINTMTTGSSANSNYAKGWSVNASDNWWHNGKISGNGAIIVRTKGGYCWAFLMNGTWEGEADSMMWKVVNGVSSWPGINLF